MAHVERIRFRLHLTPQEFQPYYQGLARYVQVQALDGRTIRFPASPMRQFVTHGGIQGTFELVVSGEGRFLELRRLAP